MTKNRCVKELLEGSVHNMLLTLGTMVQISMMRQEQSPFRLNVAQTIKNEDITRADTVSDHGQTSNYLHSLRLQLRHSLQTQKKQNEG